MEKNKRILLVGEPVGLFIAQREVELEDVMSFTSMVAGAEFNVAVGLSRLGHSVRYYTRLGNDPFGKKIVKCMQLNGIDTTLIEYSKERKTGFMLKGKTSHGDPEIAYFRENSAAAAISPRNIEQIDLSSCGYLHLTGILPSLSPSTLAATFELISRAREAGMAISFDPNLRPQLWPDQKTMVHTINELARQVDCFLPGVGEGQLLIGTSDPEQIAKHYLSLGVKTVVVKIGSKGAYAASKKEQFYSPTFHVDKIIDTVGAGDGFAAGVLSALIEGLSLKEAVCRGNAIGTIQVMNVSDNDGLPRRDELEKFMAVTPLEE